MVMVMRVVVVMCGTIGIIDTESIELEDEGHIDGTIRFVFL